MDKLYANNTIAKNTNWHWLEFIMACIAYTAANAVDYMLTVYGIMNTNIGEANPLAQSYVETLGPVKGLLIFKLFMVGIVILGVYIIDCILKDKKIKFKSEYILYTGAVATLLGGSLWLVLP